tara:strand:+ start:2785 stop:3876 length:1092 start_codon:yes stop_codon:yes gene_type:complete
MSTLKVDSIGNSGSAVNFPNNVQTGDSFARREYTSSATAPSGANNGALWWDTANEELYLKIAGNWYEAAATKRPEFYGAYGIVGGGNINSGTWGNNQIQRWTISTPGNATDFGQLSRGTGGSNGLAAVSNKDRILFFGGQSGNTTADYIAPTTPGNATAWGAALTVGLTYAAGTSNGSRGLFMGNFNSGGDAQIYYFADIANAGTATIDFGDLTVARNRASGLCDGTYAVFGGGYAGSNPGLNTIDYVTAATTGNATDFGDLTVARYALGALANRTRGVFMGGYGSNRLDYITVATPGNATTFGSQSVSRQGANGGATNGTRGTQAGGNSSSVIDYFEIDTPGNAVDFGDIETRYGSYTAAGG